MKGDAENGLARTHEHNMQLRFWWETNNPSNGAVGSVQLYPDSDTLAYYQTHTYASTTGKTIAATSAFQNRRQWQSMLTSAHHVLVQWLPKGKKNIVVILEVATNYLAHDNHH